MTFIVMTNAFQSMVADRGWSPHSSWRAAFALVPGKPNSLFLVKHLLTDFVACSQSRFSSELPHSRSFSALIRLPEAGINATIFLRPPLQLPKDTMFTSPRARLSARRTSSRVPSPSLPQTRRTRSTTTTIATSMLPSTKRLPSGLPSRCSRTRRPGWSLCLTSPPSVSNLPSMQTLSTPSSLCTSRRHSATRRLHAVTSLLSSVS